MATIQGVYVALFGRPADPLGLAYFNGITNNGANLSAISALSATKEYTDRFAGMNNNTIINSIYQSLFNRDAEPAGLAFFVDQLNKGALNINNIAIAILDGAQGADKTILDAKLASANTFTTAIDTPAEVGAYIGNTAAAAGRAFLAGITTTAATTAAADTAIAAIVATGNAGNTGIVLTAGADVVNTTSATATLKSTDLNDTITAAAGNWAAGDKIDGGFGTDTLNATVAANVTVGTDELKSVEIANIKAILAATVDVANAKELTQVWNDASTAALIVDKVALTTTIGVKGAITAGATFQFAGATGTADTANLSANAATVTGGSVTINEIETLNVANTGTSNLGSIVGNTLKTAVVTGAGDLTVNFAAAANTVVETINAGAYTGKLTTDLTNLNAIKTYTGGTGVDAVTIDGAHTNDVTINLGAGNDTLLLTAGVTTKALSVTLGGGADIVTVSNDIGNVAAIDTNANFIKTLVTITDFVKADDALKVQTTTPASDRYTLLNAEQTAAESAADLLAATQYVAGLAGVGANKFAIFNFKGDAYLFDTGAAAGLQAGDSIVKLTGVQVADLTATNLQVVSNVLLV